MVLPDSSTVHFLLQIQVANLTKLLIKAGRITFKKLSAKIGVGDGLVIANLFFVGAFNTLFETAGRKNFLEVVGMFESSLPG